MPIIGIMALLLASAAAQAGVAGSCTTSNAKAGAAGDKELATRLPCAAKRRSSGLPSPSLSPLRPAQPGNRRRSRPGSRSRGTPTGSPWRSRSSSRRESRGTSPRQPLADRSHSRRDTPIPVLTPLPHVPDHVIQSPSVRGIAPNRGRCLKVDSARIIDRAHRGIVFVLAIEVRLSRVQTAPQIKRRRRPRPARILPLRFRRQPIHIIRGNQPPARSCCVRNAQ